MIVFITIPWFLPAYKAGGPIQSIANLVATYNIDTQYYIFCGNSDLNGEANTGVSFNEWTNYNTHTKVWYDTGVRTKDNFIIQNKIIQPDVLFIIGLFSWNYNIIPLLYGKATKIILSVRGMLHPGALSQKKIKKKIFLLLLKLLCIKKKLTFHATDEAEESYLKKIFGTNTIVHIGSNFSKNIIALPAINKQAGFLKLATIALISPMKNHLLVLQALVNCTYNIEYNIYGPIKDAAYWQLCLIAINKLPKNIIVQYKAEILPSEVEHILAQHHAFIMPSKSENFGHSLSEALLAGKPIITSHFTPWSNLAENFAGANVDCNEEDILTAINFFANMKNDVYKNYTIAAVKYAQDKSNVALKIKQYNSIFGV